ncbi:MAG: PTS sugar transporter subunit IIA [Victivallaceae bacterium]|nr:PTS sugar transporter subunit IIA [Victivallaceae bacterium]
MEKYINKTAYFAKQNVDEKENPLVTIVDKTIRAIDASSTVDFRKQISAMLIEHIGKTSYLFGSYVAFPHLRTSLVAEPYLGFFTIPNSILADPVNNIKSNFCWLMIFPFEWDNEFLKFIAELEYIFRDGVFRSEIFSIGLNDDLRKYVIQEYSKYIHTSNGHTVNVTSCPDYISLRLIIQTPLGLHARPSCWVVHSYQKWAEEMNKDGIKTMVFKSLEGNSVEPNDLFPFMSFVFSSFNTYEFDIIGYNCTEDDFELFISSFGGWKVYDGIWVTDFKDLYSK